MNGTDMSDGSFAILHHILINDYFCQDWLKWTLLAKGMGCMEQGQNVEWVIKDIFFVEAKGLQGMNEIAIVFFIDRAIKVIREKT
ncbi:uncharacterized protein MONOS_17666 [Monocercomonoides exilis]|uniref:uncharacterized protein n=1 Tax=Monocercomonoides exilis TaxID=2049356 RepID=UPI00355A6904|nr:hypothetical protein MONOS_17666 [Monocercomonoides exilis]